jgi:hypothetical protein
MTKMLTTEALLLSDGSELLGVAQGETDSLIGASQATGARASAPTAGHRACSRRESLCLRFNLAA